MTDAAPMHVTGKPLDYIEQMGRAALAIPPSPRRGADLFCVEGGRGWCRVSAPSRADLKLVENAK